MQKANNPDMKEEYDPNKETSYIIPFDANSLYGYAMSQPLPRGESDWCNPTNVTLAFIKSIILKQVKLDILQADLHCPKALHDAHNDYPLAPEVMCVKANMLSQSIKEIYILLFMKQHHPIVLHLN